MPPPLGQASKPSKDGPPGDAPRDSEVERVQAPEQGSPISLPPDVSPAEDRDPLQPARERPGGAAPSVSAGATRGHDPFVLPADRVPLGAQAFGLTVDVQAPAALNINLPATLKIVVKNSGTTDAVGVVVRDELPEGLEFLSSQPETQPADSLLFWKLNTVAAGTEQIISVRVRPTKAGSFDHAATVTMMAASKSRTMVRQPQLKVELTSSPKEVLKGRPAQFKIEVSNPGDGPARNVSVQAKLSPGLRHEGQKDVNLLEHTIDRILPGEHITLEPLVVDTTQGGNQSCTVTAKSPDVSPSSSEAQGTLAVSVVEPKLDLALTGPETRYTDTVATYTLKVSNPGTAPARNVRVLATLPINGQLIAQPSEADRFDSSSRKLQWKIPQLDPGKEKTFSCQVRMGGVDFYQVTAEAQSVGASPVKKECRTNVTGMADVDFDITERLRVVDVGEVITFRIDIKNHGSKEATNLLIRANLSDNVEIVEWAAGDETLKNAYRGEGKHELVFDEIPRLGAGKDFPLVVRVKAIKDGLATCRVSLRHADLVDTNLEGMAATKITKSRPP